MSDTKTQFVLRILHGARRWISTLEICRRMGEYRAKDKCGSIWNRAAAIAASGETFAILQDLVEAGMAEERKRRFWGTVIEVFRITDAGRRRFRSFLAATHSNMIHTLAKPAPSESASTELAE